MTDKDRLREFLKCLGNGSGSEEQAYKDDTWEEEDEDERLG
jgi:hypothetical protein